MITLAPQTSQAEYDEKLKNREFDNLGLGSYPINNDVAKEQPQVEEKNFETTMEEKQEVEKIEKYLLKK